MIKIWPRQETDKGGILMMPLKKNIPKGKPYWIPTKCPECGKECWKTKEMEYLAKKQEMILRCTECGIRSAVN